MSEVVSMEEALRHCASWATATEVERMIFGAATSSSHKRVKSALVYCLKTGRAESRWTEGVGTEYRAVVEPRPSLRLAPESVRALSLLSRWMTASELAEATGKRVNATRNTLQRLRRKGLVAEARIEWTSYWTASGDPRLLNAFPNAFQTPFKESVSMAEETVRVVASDVDVRTAVMTVLVEREGGQREKVSVPLGGGMGERLASIIGGTSPLGLRGRSLRARLTDDGEVADLGSADGSVWLARPHTSEECMSLEMDQRNEL